MKSKKPAQILIPVGYLITVLYSVCMIFYFWYFFPSMFLGMLIFYIVSIAIGAIFTIAGSMALSSDYRNIALGVFIIIFATAIGGAFYLAWRPEASYEEENDYSTINYDHARELISEQTKPKISSSNDNPYEKLKDLKDLLDRGIIDKDTYDAKAKKYIDML